MVRALALLALAATACVPEGDYAGTSYQCVDNPTCPDGFTCVDGTCRTGADLADGGGDADAAPGARLEIPAGTVHRGCDAGDDACPADAQPARDITIAAFSIDATEVTEAAYAACVADGTCTAAEGTPVGDSAPVRGVSWSDADDHCRWAGGRLPTEAEWERAARGDDTRRFPWGDDAAACTRAALASCGDGPVEVGTLDGDSPFGVADLVGNVSEWTADHYQADYYATSPASNPGGPDSGGERVVRGGSYLTSADTLAAFTRLHADPLHHDADIGFRCAR